METPPLAAAGRSPCRAADGLSAAALRMLEKFPTGQFVLPPGVSLQECFERGPGHLDLFSGSRGLAKQLARSTGRFVLTFDIKHSATEDLLSDEVQRSLTAMVQCGCFSTATAGPVCSSFSRAVRPAVRSAKRPEGLPGITNNMRVKVLQGNAFSGWLAGLIAQCLDLQMVVLVENPHLSYLWWMPEWKKLASRSGCGFYVTDYCRWLMRWRKRTKFFGNFSLVGSSCLCRCSGPHIQLKGYSVLHKMSWTRVAEPYPRSLCRHLATSIRKTLDAKMLDRSLDVGACSKTGSLRVGEASNPGPRRTVVQDRPDLEEVATVQRSTLIVQRRALEKFHCWLAEELSESAIESRGVFLHSKLISCGRLGTVCTRTDSRCIYSGI